MELAEMRASTLPQGSMANLQGLALVKKVYHQLKNAESSI
jgi:hypothetical protein